MMKGQEVKLTNRERGGRRRAAAEGKIECCIRSGGRGGRKRLGRYKTYSSCWEEVEKFIHWVSGGIEGGEEGRDMTEPGGGANEG